MKFLNKLVVLAALLVGLVATTAAAEKLNPLRPLDGIYYAPGTNTALNFSHFASNSFFGIINEYDFEGTGESRWYTFTVSLDYRNVDDFAPFVELNSTFDDTHQLQLRGEPSNDPIVATGTGDLVVTTRPPGEPANSQLTGVTAQLTFYSTSVVDVTYDGKTIRFRMLPAVDGFGSVDQLDNAAYRLSQGESWVPNGSFGTIPGTPAGKYVAAIVDEADGWEVFAEDVPAGLVQYRLTYEDYLLISNGEVSPVPAGHPMHMFLERVFGASLADPTVTIIVYWSKDLDRGTAYLQRYDSNNNYYYDVFGNGNDKSYLGAVVRAADGFRVLHPDYDDRNITESNAQKNPKRRYGVIDLTRF